jgi:hypothetical protein
MQPAELTSKSFAAYPPTGAALCRSKLSLLQTLPLVLLPILLRDLSVFDWKLPAERRAVEVQLAYLEGAAMPERTALVQGFRSFSPGPDLSGMDWVNNPGGFIEKLTAWLWSTQQMDRFRQQADAYNATVNLAFPDKTPALPRLAIVVLATGMAHASSPLFRKLKPHGVYFNRIQPMDGLSTILAEASRRAAASQDGQAFRHWYIDGEGTRDVPHLTSVSYARLGHPRATLLQRIQSSIATGKMGPEELRTLLARLKPSEIGLEDGTDGGVLSHFQMSLLTEGAGTQIFATTFVQWAARECVRRAQPETLVVRYTPRQQAQTMNAMLSGAIPSGIDAEGSLIDADMGAYYTWLNLRRLSGAADLRFVVWLEGQSQAIAIGPDLPSGTSSDSALTIKGLLGLVT